jgi:biotin operon repressor
MKTDRPNPAGKALPGCSTLPPMDGPSTCHRPAGTAQDTRAGRNTGAESATPAKADRKTAQGRNRDRRAVLSKGRWRMLNEFIDAGGADLRPNDWRVWMVLFRDAKGDTARTSQKYVAKRLNLDRKTVGRAVKRLQAAGLLDVLHRGGFRRGPSTYRLRPTPADNAPREQP